MSTSLTSQVLPMIIWLDPLPKSNNFGPSPPLQNTKVTEDGAEDQVEEAEVGTSDVATESPEGAFEEGQEWVAAEA